MTLKSIYATFRSHPEGRWVMVPENVESLYAFIQKHPIKNILDLGTGIGCSSAVMAMALKDKGETDYHIDSVEQYEKCVKIANDLIPPELKEHITMHHIPPKVWQTEYMPYRCFSTYETLPEPPEEGWDLILNDGPAPFMENGYYIELQNGTITKLLLDEKIKPGAFIVWDGRIEALVTLERHFGGNFYLAEHKKPDFNVLERKDNPVIFDDLRMESMIRDTSYFKENQG